jgi:hypothetical protein
MSRYYLNCTSTFRRAGFFSFMGYGNPLPSIALHMLIIPVGYHSNLSLFSDQPQIIRWPVFNQFD